MSIFKRLVSTVGIVLFFDAIWLLWLSHDFYQVHLGSLMREAIILPSALAFYCLFSIGLMVFVVEPTRKTHTALFAAGLGSFFGLVCYGSFDLTCYAVFNSFPFIVVIVDMLWGAFLGGASALCVRYLCD